MRDAKKMVQLGKYFSQEFTLVFILHADGNITSKLIEQYSAAGC
jgi:hypothetical protein